MPDSTAPRKNRLLAERPLPRDGRERSARGARSARSVLVNLAESPLGWLKARGLVSARQYAAGESLRADWERAALGPRVTMRWDAPPQSKAARAAPAAETPTLDQVAARRRFDERSRVGGGLADVLWRVVFAGWMRDAERLWAGPRAPAACLTMRSTACRSLPDPLNAATRLHSGF